MPRAGHALTVVLGRPVVPPVGKAVASAPAALLLLPCPACHFFPLGHHCIGLFDHRQHPVGASPALYPTGSRVYAVSLVSTQTMHLTFRRPLFTVWLLEVRDFCRHATNTPIFLIATISASATRRLVQRPMLADRGLDGGRPAKYMASTNSGRSEGLGFHCAASFCLGLAPCSLMLGTLASRLPSRTAEVCVRCMPIMGHEHKTWCVTAYGHWQGEGTDLVQTSAWRHPACFIGARPAPMRLCSVWKVNTYNNTFGGHVVGAKKIDWANIPVRRVLGCVK